MKIIVYKNSAFQLSSRNVNEHLFFIFCFCLPYYGFNISLPPVCCHLFVVVGLRTSVTRIAMVAGVFILLVGSPKPDRLKD